MSKLNFYKLGTNPEVRPSNIIRLKPDFGRICKNSHISAGVVVEFGYT